MGYLLLGVAALGLLLAFSNSIAAADPARLARQLKTAGGIALLVAAVVLLLIKRFDLAFFAGMAGLSLLGLRNAKGFRSAGSSGSAAGAGQTSVVRSAYLEMTLDHETGDMDGEVLAGAFEGRRLDGLAPSELEAFYREVAGDPDSRALFEAYLDRRQPGWRVDFEADATAGQGPAPGTGAMTEEEAHQVLGLSHGASKAEIRSAHRRLMKRVHPDHGGSGFLAAKLNEAKDLLLNRH
ncbi:DnaJ domain-containing protein [Stappia sp. ES.058]|uniref:DnaJ domain-containing protein n=1 Tax=Stappia sp. ES.058 TaxID=1881061 RepID=UPI00087C45C4|nr:DnaJ domain-containing protein [Stappia sp. ES.058]SDU20015.1 DnaJ domain-containing protein [Stappia sp. ES.058]